MAELQIETQTSANQLTLSITYPSNPEMSYNFTLTLTLLEQVVASRTEVTAYKKVFHTQQRQIQIKDLKYSTMYKVVVVNRFGVPGREVQRTRNVFVFTSARRDEGDGEGEAEAEEQEERQQEQGYQYVPRSQLRPSSQSQARPNTAPRKPASKTRPKHSNTDLCNSQLLIKTLAQSNHIVYKDKAHQYLLQSRKCRNTAEFINERHGKRINPSEVSDKRMLVIQSKLLFADIYRYREGCRFFGNQWAMGPFYSYDCNQEQLRKE